MKKTILSKWPFLVLAILIGLCAAIVEGFISMYVMRAVDTALEGSRALFLSQARILLFLAVLLLPIGVALSLQRAYTSTKP